MDDDGAGDAGLRLKSDVVPAVGRASSGRASGERRVRVGALFSRLITPPLFIHNDAAD